MRLPKSIVAAVVCLLVLALSSPAVFAKPVEFKGGKVTIDTDEIAKWLENGPGDDDEDHDDEDEWVQGSLTDSPLFGLLSRFFNFRVPTGVITAIHSSKGQPTITIKTSDNKLDTYNAGNGVNTWLDGKKAKLDDLDVGDRVALILNPSGHVITIIAKSGDQTAPTPGQWQSGSVIQTIYQGSLRVLSVQQQSGPNSYILAANAQVSFRNWAAGTFADIRNGDRVTFRLADGKIVELVVETETTSDVGQITAISANSVTIKRDSGTSQTYALGQGLTLVIDGVTNPQISDVMVGDRAQVLVRDGIVRSMHVTPAANVNGTVVAVINTSGYRAISIRKPGGVVVTHALTTTAKVSFEGWAAGTFADIREGDTVHARVVDDKITNLIVVTVTSTDAGQITAISSSVISIRRQDGTLKAYPLDSNITLTIKGATNPELSDVLVGDQVELLIRDGKVRAMHVTPATNLSGTVETIGTTGDYRYISIKKADNTTQTYLLATNASVSFTDWPTGTFADIRVGDAVRVRLVDGKIITLIVTTVTSSDAGQITAISNSAISIRREDGTSKAYPFGQNMTLTIAGVSEPELSDVKVGDVANLLLRDGIVRTMHVIPANLVSGTIQTIIKTNDYRAVVVKNSSGQVFTYEFAANAKVSFKNLMTATFDDIRVGDLVTIRLAEGKVIDLVIESVATSDRGMITAISTSSVTIRRENNTSQSYQFGQNMALTIAGMTEPKLSDVLVGDKVELGLRDNVIFAMQVTPAVSITGTIETIVNNSTTKALTIKQANGVSITRTLAPSAVVIVKDQPNATFASLLVGDKVSARIIDDKIVRLEAEYVYTTVEGTVTLTSFTTTPKKIYLLATNASASEAYTLASPCDLTIPGITSPTLSQIKVGDQAALRIRGGLVRSISINPHLSIFNAIYVRTTGSSTTPGIEVIRDGAVVNYTLASSYTVVVAGKTSPTLADVAPGKAIKITMESNLVKRLEVIQ